MHAPLSNKAFISSNRRLASPSSSPAAVLIALISSNKARRCIGIRWQKSRQCLQSRFLVDDQHGPLLADDRLEVSQGDIRVRLQGATQDFEGAGIDGVLPHGDVDQGPHRGFERAALGPWSCGVPRSSQPAPPLDRATCPAWAGACPLSGVTPSQAWSQGEP